MVSLTKISENMPEKEETNQFICKVIQPLTECPSTKIPFISKALNFPHFHTRNIPT